MIAILLNIDHPGISKELRNHVQWTYLVIYGLRVSV
jgi:hypothetical protein